MIGMIIAFPSLVTGNLDKKVGVDLNTIEINVPSGGYGGGGYGGGGYANEQPKTEEDPIMKSLKENN